MINEQKSRAEVCTAFTHFERFVSRFVVSPPTATYPLTYANILKISDKPITDNRFFGLFVLFITFLCSVFRFVLSIYNVFSEMFCASAQIMEPKNEERTPKYLGVREN